MKNEEAYKIKKKIRRTILICGAYNRFTQASSLQRSKMETEKTKQNEEIEETSTTNTTEKSSSPNPGTVKTSEPEIQVHLFRRGKGPIDIFTSSLGGWDQNQLEVRDILEKYGFKSVFAFNRESGRGVPIRFNPRNGRSILPYKSGSVIFIDGEPKVSANI